MFGNKKDQAADAVDPAFTAEVERLAALSLPQLAAEVMGKAFGPGGTATKPDDATTVGGPNLNSGVTPAEIATGFFALGHWPRDPEVPYRIRLEQLVAEGLQELEHSSLVRAQMHTAMNELDFAATRAGRAALEQSAVESIVAAQQR